ncbi:MAG: MFS transporter [Actinomycetota bacterium]
MTQQEAPPHPVETMLDEARFTRTHRKVWLLSAMGVLLDGFDFFIMGVALPLIVQEWSLGSVEKGLVGSSAVVGAVVGASCLGALTDRIGRQRAFRLDLGMFVVFSLLSALAPGLWWLIVFRFLLGVGIGADYPIGSSYVAEIAPRRIRGRLIVSAFSAQAIGQLLGVVVGLIILNVYPEFDAWRWMLGFGVIPAVIVVYLRRGVPESPRWLVHMGRYDEAAHVLSEFTERTVDRAELAGHVAGDADEQIAPLPPPWRQLFRRPLRRKTALTAAPWFLMDIATYGIGVFTPTIIAAIIVSDTSQGTTHYLADDITATEGAAFVDIFLIVGFALAIWLIATVGKINLQTIGFIVMAAALLLLANTTGPDGGDDSSIVVVFIGFALFNVFMNMGPNSTTYLMPAEVYPTLSRASGAGLAAAAGKTGAALGTLLFPILEDDIGLNWTLALIATGCLFAAAITYALRAEARSASS